MRTSVVTLGPLGYLGGMRTLLKTILAALLVAGLFTVGGCSKPAPVVTTGATIIDVRTPSEYAAGHLEGAVNIDFQGATFESQIGALPKDGTYLLYCRSGSRAGSAMTQMKQMGFTHVTNLGSLQAAADATGKKIVT